MDLTAAAAGRPWRTLTLYMALASAAYTLAAHRPLLRPFVVEPAAYDSRIPFIPAAAGLYLSYQALLPALIVVAHGLAGFARVLTTALACGLTNIAIYLVAPTELASRAAAPPGTLLAFVQRLDTTGCALPSGHVALPVSIAISALIVARKVNGHDARRWRWTGAAFSIWAFALAVSALVTKQHYIVDVIAGAAFGALTAVGFVLSTSALHRFGFHQPTLRALAMEWAIIVAVLAAALLWWTPAVVAPAVVVVATRQHALLALYHDGVHGLVARSLRANDFVVNMTAGVPMLLPIHLYRALHLSHHQHLGTEHDPERVLLYRGQAWSYHPLGFGPLAGQLAGDLFGWNAVAMTWRYFDERRHPQKLRLPATGAHPELVAQFALFCAAWGLLALQRPHTAGHLAFLWFVPYLTVTQLLQKIRSFAEHQGDSPGDGLSCSWAPGVMGRFAIWPHNINYHREHHRQPTVPWDRLPEMFPHARQRPGHGLTAHVWNGALR